MNARREADSWTTSAPITAAQKSHLLDAYSGLRIQTRAPNLLGPAIFD
ncbi:MAG: hypothetical protein ACE5PO_08150 [Candidatus Bathyarchaeia archaeon]